VDGLMDGCYSDLKIDHSSQKVLSNFQQRQLLLQGDNIRVAETKQRNFFCQKMTRNRFKKIIIFNFN
jgi:hypothetical protein